MIGFTTEYDKASNKLYERLLHAENRSQLYEPFAGAGNLPQGGYDSLDRLRQVQRGTLSSTGGLNNQGGGSITTPVTLPGTDKSRSYDLDGLGNWKKTVYTPQGASDPTTELRRHNYLNEITKFGSTAVLYDGVPGASNGNLADDGTRLMRYDGFNRLIEVRRKSDNAVIATYRYDALGRRTQKTVSNGGISGTVPDGITDYLYLGDQCIEERDMTEEADTVIRQNIWGIYIDELIQLKTYVTLGSQELEAGDYYPLQDLLYRTQALTDDEGAIVEVYDFDAYGNTLIFGDYDSEDALAVPVCENLFTGRSFCSEIGGYDYITRYYWPEFGRFGSKDWIGYEGGINLYEYVHSCPSVFTDPHGLAALEDHHWFPRQFKSAFERRCRGFHIDWFTTSIPTQPYHKWLHGKKFTNVARFAYNAAVRIIISAAKPDPCDRSYCCKVICGTYLFANFAWFAMQVVFPSKGKRLFPKYPILPILGNVLQTHEWRNPNAVTTVAFHSLCSIWCDRQDPPPLPAALPDPKPDPEPKIIISPHPVPRPVLPPRKKPQPIGIPYGSGLGINEELPDSIEEYLKRNKMPGVPGTSPVGVPAD